jgi:hypothetical protein
MNEELWKKEPPPIVNNKPAIWDLVLSDLSRQKFPPGSIQEKTQLKLMDDIKLRDRTGYHKYGTRLQPFNGRDALKDAYEEHLDSLVYMRQALFEAMDTVIVTKDSEAYKLVLMQHYKSVLENTLRLKFIIEMKKELANVSIINTNNN